MASSNPDWRTPAGRQRMINTMINVMRSKGMQVSPAQLNTYEKEIFVASNGYDDYKKKLSKLIQHLQNVPNRGKPQMAVNQPMQAGQQPMYNTTAQSQGQPGPQQMQQDIQMNVSNMSMHQMPGSSLQQQLATSTPMPGQPIGQPISAPQIMGNTGGYMGDPSFSQSPAPSQPQIPPLTANFPLRPAYSPGPGMPMPSPTQGVMRAPHPSPSMSMNVNTPAPAMTPQDPQAPSPASLLTQTAPQSTLSNADEDQLYMEKVRELSSYVEPLKKMLSKMNKEGRTNQPDYNKLCVLLNLLQPSNNKTSYDMLCKCEDVLRKLKLPPTKANKDSIHDPNSHWCQPLLTAVAESINASTTCKNALRQTFGPAMHVLYGPNYSSTLQPLGTRRKRKNSGPADAAVEKKKPVVPQLVQGELARLDKKFKVSRDSASQNMDGYKDGQGIRLQCVLDDRGLPSVPPLKFIIPDEYPETSPVCDRSMELYETAEFFTDIKNKFLNSLKRLHIKHSMTALLETWLLSVKQTSANHTIENKDLRKPLVAQG